MKIETLFGTVKIQQKKGDATKLFLQATTLKAIDALREIAPGISATVEKAFTRYGATAEVSREDAVAFLGVQANLITYEDFRKAQAEATATFTTTPAAEGGEGTDGEEEEEEETAGEGSGESAPV